MDALGGGYRYELPVYRSAELSRHLPECIHTVAGAHGKVFTKPARTPHEKIWLIVIAKN